MTWTSLILAVLKLATSLIGFANQRSAIEAGQDKEIARAALMVLEATTYGKELRASIAALTDEEADDLWDRMVSR